MNAITFFVSGIPRPGGSKTAKLIRRKGGAIVMKNGRPLITMRDDAKGNEDWKAIVAYTARAAYAGVPMDTPLRVQMEFFVSRPKGHFRTNGQLRPSAPAHPAVKPDVLKLARSTEDACTGILWVDDSLTTRLFLSKDYGDKPGVRITIDDAVGKAVKS